MHPLLTRLSALFLLSALVAFPFQGSQKGEDDSARTVRGTVTDQDGKVVAGAVVQLKNTKNLQIRSFITKQDGAYYFHGLDPNVDFQLKAEHEGASSSVKTLSSFDSNKKPLINLKLEPPKGRQ